MTMYTSPFIACVDHRRCAGTLGCMWYACLIPAGVAMPGWCMRRPISASNFALLSASSLPAIPWCPLTHIKYLGLSRICFFSSSSIHDLGAWYCRSHILCITPWLSRAAAVYSLHASITPIDSVFATIASVPRYRVSPLPARLYNSPPSAPSPTPASHNPRALWGP